MSEGNTHLMIHLWRERTHDASARVTRTLGAAHAMRQRHACNDKKQRRAHFTKNLFRSGIADMAAATISRWPEKASALTGERTP
jgi:hypothetical protein